MAQNLWEIRQKKQLTVKQLAGKSGVKASDIYAYESGETIRMADLGKLAKALYVDSSEIKLESDPLPKQKPAPAKQSAPAKQPAPAPQPSAKAATPAKAQPVTQASSKQPTPAREGQIAHLRDLAARLGESETAVSARIGKPLEELSFQEARQWLATYTQEYSSRRPADTRRKRVHLPESVDTFELTYLETQQEAGSIIIFTLFDKREFSGRIVGFSPYAITIQQADGSELTIQKLALAYYTVAGGTPS